MGTTLKTLVVKLVGDTSDYTEDMRKAETTARTTTERMVSMGNLTKGVLGGAAVAGGLLLVTNALGTIKNGLQDMANEAMEAQNVEAELNAVLTSTGGIAGVTRSRALELADSFQNVTRFEDDTILSAEAMLLTFTKIGRDVFPEATEATLNMAQKFGNMETAAVQVGKALNDPITGVTALRRVGVALTNAQEKQIKTFMEMGDVASAQRVILAELSTEFGGLARAAGETAAGRIDIFNNKIGALKEKVGTSLVSLLTTGLSGVGPVILGALERVADAASKFIDGLVTGIQSVGAAFQEANIPDAIADITNAFSAGGGSAFDWGDVGRGFVADIGEIVLQFQFLGQQVAALWSGLQQMGDAFSAWFSATFGGMINMVKEAFLGLGATVRGVFARMTGDSAGAAVAFAEAADHALRQATAWREFSVMGAHWMKELGRDAANLVESLRQIEAAQRSATNAFRSGAALTGTGVSDAEQEKRDMRLYQGQKRLASNVVKVWDDAGTKMADSWGNATDKMTSFIESAVSSAQGALKGLLPGQLGGDMFAPGANGPFENIYRAADVAARGAASPWADKLGLDQAAAQQIVSDFSKGLITDQVKAMIDMPALVDAAKMAALAEQMKSSFVAEVAKIAGVKPGVVESLMGYGPNPTAPAAVATNTSTLVEDMSKAFDGKGGDFEEMGKSLLTKISDGVSAMADSLITNVTVNVTDPIVAAFDKATDAVDRLISAITRLRDMNATPPAAAAGGTPPGTGSGGTTAAGARGGAAAGSRGVVVVQNFHGQMDYATVRAAAEDGVYAATRRQGYRW